MNESKTYIRLQKPDVGNLPKLFSPTRYPPKNGSLTKAKQNEDNSARTFLHVESRVTKSLDSNKLISNFSCLKRTMDGQGRKFSSTTIVNGSASTHRRVNPACSDGRVVVLPVETIIPDEISSQVGIFMDADEIKKEETFTLTEDLPESCYFTVQEDYALECTLEPDSYPRKIKRPSQQKLLLPAAGNGKRGLIRFGRSRMIADTHTSIPVAEFKAQLSDSSDIIGKLELAPSTKRMMHLLNTKGVNKLFAIPGRKMGSKTTFLFTRHLTLKQMPDEVTHDDMPLLPVGFVPEIDKSKIKRITRKRRYPEAEEYQRNLFKTSLEYLSSIDIDPGDQSKISAIMNEDMRAEASNRAIHTSHTDHSSHTGHSSHSSHESHTSHESHATHSKDDVAFLGSMTPMDAMEVPIHEEEVLDDILYADQMMDDDEVLVEAQEDCDETFIDDKSTIILMNGKEGTSENIEEVLAEAEKRGINRDDIQKVIIYQQDQLEDETDELFADNGKFIIMSCDPSESEIVISS